MKEIPISLKDELLRSPKAHKQFVKSTDQLKKLDFESAITASVAATAVTIASCACSCELNKRQLNDLLRAVAASMKSAAHEIYEIAKADV